MARQNRFQRGPQQPDQLFQSFSKGLYRLTGEESTDNVLNMLSAPQSTNAQNVQTSSGDVGSGVSSATTPIANGALEQGKSTFDNTVTGFILGVDSNSGFAKFYIGNTTKYINWDGSNLTVVGGVSISQLDIPDTITTNSFHVDNSGNSWWGSTTLAGAPASVTNAGVANFTSITVAGYAPTSALHFGGTGADGALSVSSGTTTIDLAGAQVFIKNYTSISVTGTAVIAFINPNASGTLVVFRSQGNVTWTSSATPSMDLTSIGSAGGAGATTGGGPGSGNTGGSFGTWIYQGTIGGGGGGQGAGTPGGGGGGASMTSSGFDGGGGAARGLGGIPPAIIPTTTFIQFMLWPAIPGAGGGGGGINGAGTAGVGGIGGGSFYCECAGALNITSAFQSNGSAGASVGGGGQSGGGGGGAGCFVFIYNTLTANAATFTMTGGAHGTGGVGGQSGGVGAAGSSFVYQNFIFT